MSNWTVQDFQNYMRRRMKEEQYVQERIQTNANTFVGAVSSAERKHDLTQTLDRNIKRIKKGRESVAFRVSIISIRHRLLDRDNLIAGSKWLRDQIAETIGFDDAEGSGVEWEYSQILTQGEQGVIVKIERV